MNIQESVALKVLSKTDIEPDQKFGSILAILMIIGIIVNVIRAIQECEKNKLKPMNFSEQSCYMRERFRYFSLSRNWYASMKLKKIIRKELSIEDYRKYKYQIHDAILETALTISDQETYALMEQIQ